MIRRRQMSGTRETHGVVVFGLAAAVTFAGIVPGFVEQADDAAPSLVVTTTAASFDGGQPFEGPTTVAETGSDVVFDVSVANTSTTTVWLTDLSDSHYGDITTVGHPEMLDTTCRLGSPAVTAPVGGILPGATYRCSFTAEVQRSGRQELERRATVSAVAVDRRGTTTSASTDEQVLSFTLVSPTVSMTKTDGGATVPEPGGDVAYALEITNTSNESVTITRLTDVITYAAPPAVSAELDLLAPTAPVAGSTCAAVTIAAGADYRCEFVVTLSGTAQLVGDVAEVTVEDDDAAAGVIPPVTATASDTTPITIDEVGAGAADLAIVKTASAAVVDQGRPVSFELRVVNQGPAVATDVEVSDAVPAAFDVIGISSADFACAAGGDAVRCTRPELAVGAAGIVVVQAIVNAGVTGAVSNTATVAGGVPDPDADNNTSTISIEVPEVAVVPPSTAPPPTAPSTTPPTTPPTGPPTTLPSTGTSPSGMMAIAAGALMAGCALVVGSVRRRRHTS
jgi:uncharacterized repeat protein (TIGR01451 family)/LPXTG-motif cell wall-anchored protein